MTQQQQKHITKLIFKDPTLTFHLIIQLLPDTQIRKEADRFINHCFASHDKQKSNTHHQIPNASIGSFNITYNNNTTDNDPNNNSTQN